MSDWFRRNTEDRISDDLEVIELHDHVYSDRHALDVGGKIHRFFPFLTDAFTDINLLPMTFLDLYLMTPIPSGLRTDAFEHIFVR